MNETLHFAEIQGFLKEEIFIFRIKILLEQELPSINLGINITRHSCRNTSGAIQQTSHVLENVPFVAKLFPTKQITENNGEATARHRSFRILPQIDRCMVDLA